MGIQLPSPEKGAEPPQFSAHVYCGQTTGWMKTRLGSTEADLGPGSKPHCVRRGPSSPPARKGHSSPPPLFGPRLLWSRSPTSATAEFLFKIAAICHLGFVVCMFGHPQRVFSGIYHCAEFGWNRYSSFDNMQVLIFNVFGLRMPIHAPNGWCFLGFYPRNGEQSHRYPKRHLLAQKHVIRRIDHYKVGPPDFEQLSLLTNPPKSCISQWARHFPKTVSSRWGICIPI